MARTSERNFIKQQIKRLEAEKRAEIDSFVGRCEKINDEIRHYKRLLKQQEAQ